MNKILCFVDKDNIELDLQILLDELDSAGNEVHLYTNAALEQNDPLYVLYELDYIKTSEVEGNEYIFITNMKVMFGVIYRMLHQVFDQFVYYDQAYTMDYCITGIYLDIFGSAVSEHESLHKPILSNVSSLQLFGRDYITKDFDKLFTKAPDAEPYREMVRKYYYYNGIYYLFEPVLAEKKIVIFETKEHVEDVTKFIFPGFHKLQYMYAYPQDSLNELFLTLDRIVEEDTIKVLNMLSSLEKEVKDFFPIVRHNTFCILEDAAQLIIEDDIYRALLLYSFLMQAYKSISYYNKFLDLTLNSRELTSENRFFIWHQCKRYSLTQKIKGDQTSTHLSRSIYHKSFREYTKLFEEELKPIKKEDRNPDLIVVFTIQFLAEGHAPTRTTLERCYTLGKLLGKKILLINTREQYTDRGGLLVYQPSFGNIIQEYNDRCEYQYKDLSIPFYQPKDSMPSVPVISEILEQIRKLKPYLIFSIGNGSIVADLCGRLVPEASIGVAFSTLTTTEATFSVIGRKIGEPEWDNLLRNNYTKDSIIESTFTFELKEKKRKVTRESLKLPTDRFLLVTVGIRLDTEVDDYFFEMLEETYRFGTHIVFAGYFERYGYFCDRHPGLLEHSTFVGFYEDILSLMEVCDLYVNPRRLGGGFSIIEAFHEGKPGVTLNTGDISVAAGKDFCVSDYKEMVEVIKKYIEEPDFYHAMVEKARAREVVVTSSAIAMEDIINKIQNSPLFF
ncbi:MAG TPA: glycosyltransferase [Mobilitalea sp.]|nr:glycosyltransferase [Mobilitalea sp.]